MKHYLIAILILLVTSIIGTFAFTIVTLRSQEQDMDLISLAGRQRMLNQQQMKAIFMAAQGLPADYLTPQKAMNRTLDTFMSRGQMLEFPERNETVGVPDFTEREIVEIVLTTKEVLHEFSSKADAFLQLSARDGTYDANLQELLVLNNRMHDLTEQTVARLTQFLENRLSTIIQWEIVNGILVVLFGLFLTQQVFVANRKRDQEMEEREKTEKHLSLQYAITRILSESRNIHDGISGILETLSRNFHWAFASYWEVDAEVQIMRCREVGPSSGTGFAAFAEATKALALTKGHGLPGYVWQTGSPVSIWNVEEDQNFPRAPIAVQAGLHGAMGFPVQINTGTIGVIEVFSRQLEPLDADLLYLFSLLGKQIGQFIQRQQDHDTIAESEVRLREILKFAHDGVVFLDDALCIQLFNESAQRIFGYHQEEVLGRPLDNLLPFFPADEQNPDTVEFAVRRKPNYREPDCLTWLINHCSSCTSFPETNQKTGTTLQVRGRRKDGSIFPVEASISKFSLKNQHAFIIILRDITQRQAWEETIQKSYQFIEEILTSISAILISVDNDGKIRQWSTTAEKTFGMMAWAVLGQPFTSCAIPWDWSMVNHGVRQCLETQEAVHIETLRYTTECGKEGFLELNINPIRDKHNGEASGFLILGKDISRKKQLEMQLVLAQKMESIGQLAAGIAHEINTPMQFVSDNLLFLKESFASIQGVLNEYGKAMQAFTPASSDWHRFHTLNTMVEEADLDYAMAEIPKALSQSLDGAKRVTNIVAAMKDFSHPGSTEKSAVDLNKAIESTIVVARNEWKYVSDVVTDFDPDLPLVPCLRGELSQVILNLLVNAAHAIADVVRNTDEQKGTITVSTRTESNWAEIRIADTGTGIPVESRDKIFDPFYTTKEVGIGTGQGLAIAHNVIVDKHRGSLTFDTTLGAGTTFLIRLPLQPAFVAEEVS